MLSTIQGLFDKSDTKTLSKALLHSSRWLLGERLHYGPIQQRELMANWLDIMANCNSLKLCVSVKEDNFEAGVFAFSSQSVNSYFIVVCEHSDGKIKQLLQWADSASIARLYAKQNKTSTLNFWPEPDPLKLSEFDPQLHQYTTHADFSNIANTLAHKKALSQWWQVWQGFDASLATELYRSCEHFSCNSNQIIDGTAPTSPSIIQWLTNVEGKLHRRYSQLEQVISDENSALVRWRIDADICTEKGRVHVRIPIATLLTFKQGNIASEYWVIDSLAFEKRFNTSLPL